MFNLYLTLGDLKSLPEKSFVNFYFLYRLNAQSEPLIRFRSDLMNVFFLVNQYFQRLEKKLDGNYTRMLRAILNKSWQQHPTRHQLYGHLPPITKTIQVRRTRHAGHCWRSRDELIRDVLLWIPTHGRAKAGRPARTYIQQLCEDTGCCPEDPPRAMNDREEWRERVRDIRAASTIWWWWWWFIMQPSNFWYWNIWNDMNTFKYKFFTDFAICALRFIKQ